MAWDEPDMTEEEEILQGLVIEDVAGEFRELLEEIGFEHVQLTELEELPAYSIAWLLQALDLAGKHMLMKAIQSKEGPRYWLVETEWGNFGIHFAGKPFIDLKNTGLYAHQIDASLVTSQSPLCLLSKQSAYQLFVQLKKKHWE